MFPQVLHSGVPGVTYLTGPLCLSLFDIYDALNPCKTKMKTNQPWINNVVFKLPPKSSRKKKSQDKESKTSLGHVMNRLLEEMIAKNWMSKCDQNKTAQFLKDQRIEHPHLQRQQIFSEKP